MSSGARAAPAQLPEQALDRARLLAFVGLLAALNGFSDRLLSEFGTHGLADAVLGMGGVSAIGWFACYAIAAIAAETGPAEPRRVLDCVVAGGTLLLCLVPLSVLSAMALLPCGGYAVFSSGRSSRTRRIGVVLLALTGPLLWGRILLAWFAPLLLGLDAHLAAWLVGAPVSGNTVQFLGTGDFLYVAPACSSMHNISLAILLWATLLQLLRLRLSAALVAVGTAGALVMGLVNVIRLAAIARYPADFEYLHSGMGMEWFAWVSLLAAAAIIGGGILVTAIPRD